MNGHLARWCAAVSRDAHLDGKFLLRTADETLSAADIAEGYKGLT